MTYWKGEVEYWLDDSSEVVFYSGPPGARQQIAANELWLQPGALDGKVRSEVDALRARVPKPHIMVTSMESMLQVCFHQMHALACRLLASFLLLCMLIAAVCFRILKR